MEEFWAIFEVHGVEVVPLTSPDEAVAFEDFDHFVRDAISVNERFAGPLRPAPIVGVFDIDIDGHGECMGTQTMRSFDPSPIECACGDGDVSVESRRQCGEFGTDPPKGSCCPMTAVEAEGFPSLVGHPVDVF